MVKYESCGAALVAAFYADTTLIGKRQLLEFLSSFVNEKFALAAYVAKPASFTDNIRACFPGTSHTVGPT